MNRLLLFLADPDATAYSRAARLRRAVLQRCEEIEAASQDETGEAMIEFWPPSVDDLMEPDSRLRWFHCGESISFPVADLDNLADAVVDDLRNTARALLAVADRIVAAVEGGAE